MALSKEEQGFLDTLKSLGITDPKAQANAMAQIKGESSFIPREENLRYSPSRLLKMFPNRFKDIKDATQVVGQGTKAVAERIYGDRKDLGNNMPGDGYRYRGRGLIQLTGRYNYEQMGKMIGVDLLNNPELANDPAIAAKIAATYLVQRSPDLRNVEQTTKAVGPANTKESIAKRSDWATQYENKIAEASKPPPPADTRMPNFEATDMEFGGAVPETVPGAEEQMQIDRVNAAGAEKARADAAAAQQGGVVSADQVLGTPAGLNESFGGGFGYGGLQQAAYTGPIPGFQPQSSKAYSPQLTPGGAAGTARMPQGNFGSTFFAPAIGRAAGTPQGLFSGYLSTPAGLQNIGNVEFLNMMRNRKLFG